MIISIKINDLKMRYYLNDKYTIIFIIFININKANK